MQGSRIRAARPEDLPALPAIERAAARRFAGLGLLDDAALERTVSPASLDAGQAEERLWVAADGADLPVGFALASVLGGAAHLEELDVVPEAGGRGLGSALLDTVVTWAEARGLPAVTLSTFADVPWNAPFYARRGFVALPDGALTPALRALRTLEQAAGLPVERRTMMRRNLRPERLVLYDGACGLCHATVRRLLAADRAGILHFAPLDGPTADAVRAAHPELPAGLDSIVFVERDASGRERASWRAQAAFRIAAALGGRWRALAWLEHLPRVLTDRGYRLVARVRHRLFPPDPSCPLPAPGVAARFLP